MRHPHPDKQHVVDCCRRYILACGRKFTGRQHGTARSLIHYRGLLETYVVAKREQARTLLAGEEPQRGNK